MVRWCLWQILAKIPLILFMLIVTDSQFVWTRLLNYKFNWNMVLMGFKLTGNLFWSTAWIVDSHSVQGSEQFLLIGS